jgi:hypothetical protein
MGDGGEGGEGKGKAKGRGRGRGQRERAGNPQNLYAAYAHAHGRAVRRTVRVVVRVSVCPSFVRPSLCLSDNFSDANPDPTSDRPSSWSVGRS